MDYKIFNVTPDTAELSKRIGLVVGASHMAPFKMDAFSDGEYSPQFLSSIRNNTVFLIGTTADPHNIVKMFLALDAAKRASAAKIVAVLPYYGYSRQDKKEGPRGAIGAKLMADLLETAGATTIIALELHATQIEGYFNCPVNHIHGHTIFLKELEKRIDAGVIGKDHPLTICAPDAGGVLRAMKYYKKLLKRPGLDVDFAMMEKHREKPNEISHMELIGNVKGRDVVLIDDMGDTMGTVKRATSKLIEAEANSTRVILTHPVFSGNAYKNLEESQADEFIVSDSLPLSEEGLKNDRITVVSSANIFAKVTEAVAKSGSMHRINSLEETN